MADFGAEQQQQNQLGLIPGLPDDLSMDCLIKVPHRFHSNLRCVCQNWRSLISSSSYYSRRRLSKTTDPLICLIQSHVTDLTVPGKSNIWDPRPTYTATLYNPIANTWHRHPSITIPIFARSVEVAGKLILFGGWDSVTLNAICDVQIVDTATGQCRRGKPMSIARSFFAYAVVGSFVYIAGGHDNQKNALNTAEIYDPDSDEWQSLPTMNEERDECQGVSIGGKFMVISGYTTDNQGGFRRGGESYDPKTLKWVKEDDELWGSDGDLPWVESPRSVIFALPTPKGERLWHLDCSARGKCIKEYDWNAKAWCVVADAPEKLETNPFVTVVGGEEVFVVGSDGEKKHRAWMMKDTRIQRKWEEIIVPFEFSNFAYSPVAFFI